MQVINNCFVVFYEELLQSLLIKQGNLRDVNEFEYFKQVGMNYQR